jgi:hypothetical protein
MCMWRSLVDALNDASTHRSAIDCCTQQIASGVIPTQHLTHCRIHRSAHTSNLQVLTDDYLDVDDVRRVRRALHSLGKYIPWVIYSEYVV